MRAGRGHEAVIRILGIDAALDGVAAQLDVFLLEGQRLTLSDTDLEMNEVGAGDQLGDGMFDLEPRVHFEEIEVLLLIEEEFDRAGVGVPSGEREVNRSFAHALAEIRIDDGGGGFLDDLLVTSLDRAFALAEGDAVAMLVGKDLDFDVTRTFDELLEIDFAGTERALGFATGGGEGGGQIFRTIHGAHTFAAAAGSGLQHDGIANACGNVGGLFGRGEAMNAAGSAGHTRFVGGLAGVGLGTENAHGRRRRPDELDAAVLAHLSEICVF